MRRGRRAGGLLRAGGLGARRQPSGPAPRKPATLPPGHVAPALFTMFQVLFQLCPLRRRKLPVYVQG